jgi:hypothetical protein
LERTVLTVYMGESTKTVDMRLPPGYNSYCGQNIVEWLNGLYTYARTNGVSYATLNMNIISKGSKLFQSPYLSTVERFIERKMMTQQHLVYYFSRYVRCPQLQAWGSFRLRLDLVYLFQSVSIDTPQQLHFRIEREKIERMTVPLVQGKRSLVNLKSIIHELTGYHESIYPKLDEALFEMDLHSILKRSDTSNRLFQKFISAYTAKAQEVQVARQVHKTKGDISKQDILFMVADKFQQESAIEGIVGETNLEEQMLEMKKVIESTKIHQSRLEEHIRRQEGGQQPARNRHRRREEQRNRQGQPTHVNSLVPVGQEDDFSTEGDDVDYAQWEEPAEDAEEVRREADYNKQYETRLGDIVQINSLTVLEQVQSDPKLGDASPCLGCGNAKHSYNRCTLLWYPRGQPPTLSTHKLGTIKQMDEVSFEVLWKRILEIGLLKGAPEAEVSNHLELVDQHAKLLAEQAMQRRETQQAQSMGRGYGGVSYGGQQNQQYRFQGGGGARTGGGYGNSGYSSNYPSNGGWNNRGFSGRPADGRSGEYTAPNPNHRR